MSKNVLICDDSAMIRQMIADSLAEDDWEVSGEAGDGRQAIEEYKRVKPDAVTMDLVMDGCDGMIGLRKILEYDNSAKIVVVSSVTNRGVVADALKYGALDFVVKPFSPDQIRESLASCLAGCETK